MSDPEALRLRLVAVHGTLVLVLQALEDVVNGLAAQAPAASAPVLTSDEGGCSHLHPRDAASMGHPTRTWCGDCDSFIENGQAVPRE